MPAALKLLVRAVAMGLALGIAQGALAVDALTDGQFVGFLQAANDFSVGSAKMALAKSTDAGIRDFANSQLSDYSKTVGQLARARRAAGVPYAQSPDRGRPRHTAVLDRLGALDGAGFEKAYIDAQLAAQRDVLDQVEAYAESGANPDLRRFAEELAPKLQAHIDQARRISKP